MHMHIHAAVTRSFVHPPLRDPSGLAILDTSFSPTSEAGDLSSISRPKAKLSDRV